MVHVFNKNPDKLRKQHRDGFEKLSREKTGWWAGPFAVLMKMRMEESHDAGYNKKPPCRKGTKMKIYDGKKDARLGTKRNPALVTVQTEERRKEVAAIFEEKGWELEIGIEPDKPEDVTALEILQNWPKPRVVENKIGRNDPCSCGSGQKYKKCCGR